MSCYAKILKVGRTSITVKVEAFARRGRSGKQIQVTEGVFTYVAVDSKIKAAAGVKCSRLPLRIAIHFLPTLATSGPGCLVMVTWRQARFLRTTCWGSLLLALSRRTHPSTPRCPLMTQSGRSLPRSGRSAPARVVQLVGQSIKGSIWQTGAQLRGWRGQSHVAAAAEQSLILRGEAIPVGASVVATSAATIMDAMRMALVLWT